MSNTFLQRLMAHPVRLEPRYATAKPNDPVRLHSGDLELNTDGKAETVHGQVTLVWTPSPRIEVALQDSDDKDPFSNAKRTIRNPRTGSQVTLHWTNAHHTSNPNDDKPALIGELFDNALSPGLTVRAVLFHLANGLQFRGAAVRDATGMRESAARAEIHCEPWKITLDATPDWFSSESRSSLERAAGYAITHVGRIERADGAIFTYDSIDELLEALGMLLSFCRGAATRPLLLCGLDDTDQVVAETWRCHGVEAAHRRASWFTDDSIAGLSVFPNMCARLKNPIWAEPIRLALHWFLTSNNARDVSIEGAIVLQQAAFELLCWTSLVEDRKILSADGVQKLPASDKLRLLLADSRIPLSIPGELRDLAAIAKEYNWPDGPAATTEIRNALVHANPDKRTRILDKPTAIRYDAWVLGQWYLELLLLRLFDYSGRYLNRLRRGVWKTAAIERVPWAES